MNKMEFSTIEYLKNLVSSGELKSILIQILIILFISAFLDYLQRRTINKISDTVADKDTRFVYLRATIKIIRIPISFFLYIMSVSVSIDLLNQILNIPLLDKISNLRTILITFCLCYLCINFIKQLKEELIEDINKGNSGDKTKIQVLSNIGIIISTIVFGLMVLQDLGLSVSGLMAFGGIGGLIAGLSAKELLSDFFGGLVLMTDKPFKVGDWIRSPDRNIEGVVEEIGMRRICVRTFDKRPLYIPNSIMATITIENPSRMTNRRINETIGVRYEDADKVSAITRRIKDMLEKHSGIDATQTLMVNVYQFGSHSVDFFIYTFTKTTDWTTFHGIKHNILLNVYDIIKEEGADIAFPTSIVNIQRNPINKEIDIEKIAETIKKEAADEKKKFFAKDSLV